MNNQSLKVGTVTGTALTLLSAVSWIEIERTLILGGVGAAVSFLVSYFLKKTLDRWPGEKKSSE